MKSKFYLMVALFIFLYSMDSCTQINSAPSLEFQGDQNAMLSLTISLDKTEYNVGEPILVTLTLTNIGNKELIVNKRMALNSPSSPKEVREISYVVTDSSGHVLQFFARINTRKLKEEDFIVLSPGESIKIEQSIQYLYNITKPDSYFISAFYQNMFDPKSGIAWKGEIESNQVDFKILDAPDGS